MVRYSSDSGYRNWCIEKEKEGIANLVSRIWDFLLLIYIPKIIMGRFLGWSKIVIRCRSLD